MYIVVQSTSLEVWQLSDRLLEMEKYREESIRNVNMRYITKSRFM